MYVPTQSDSDQLMDVESMGQDEYMQDRNEQLNCCPDDKRDDVVEDYKKIVDLSIS